MEWCNDKLDLSIFLFGAHKCAAQACSQMDLHKPCSIARPSELLPGCTAGHSLGAAVAVLSTIKLLKQLPAGSQPQLACIIFACPAVGNAALADLVAASGWSGYFRNHLIPGKPVPLLG